MLFGFGHKENLPEFSLKIYMCVNTTCFLLRGAMLRAFTLFIETYLLYCIFCHVFFAFIYMKDSCVAWGYLLSYYSMNNHLVPGSSWLYFSWRFKFVITNNTNTEVSLILLELLH